MTESNQKPTEAPPSSSDPRPVLSLGEIVDETYEVRSHLGAGGMGEVYEVHDRVLNRRVALKVAHPGGASEYLLREGRALAAIHHPGVVAVHTMGMHRGVAYLVMERIRGLSVDRLLDERRSRGERFGIAEALELLVSVADALSVVHRAGLAHRDVKPGNVMLALSGDVAEGAASLVDVYALGVLAYELLRGVAPFDGGEPVELYRAKTRAKQPRVSEYRPDVPAALDELVAQLMAPDAHDRPQGAEAALWQLRALRTSIGQGGEVRPFSVLVVDDDADIRAALTLYVRAAAPDAEIEETADGRQAVRAVRRRVPDLLLLDLDLPDINGIEVCMLLRGMQLGDACMVVSVSGRATKADVELLQQLGVRSLEKGPELMTELAALVMRMRPGR